MPSAVTLEDSKQHDIVTLDWKHDIVTLDWTWLDPCSQSPYTRDMTQSSMT